MEFHRITQELPRHSWKVLTLDEKMKMLGRDVKMREKGY